MKLRVVRKKTLSGQAFYFVVEELKKDLKWHAIKQFDEKEKAISYATNRKLVEASPRTKIIWEG